MSNYTITTDFGAKDNLPSGNAAKVIKGSEFSVEFTNIKTAVNSKADLNAPNFTGAVDFGNTVDIVGDLTVDTNTFHVDVTNNRVGIGTTSPTTALDVTGTVTASGLTVDTTTLHVDASNDRVGIGTTNPDKDLHITATTYGPTIRLERNQSEIPEGGVIGQIEFESRDDSTGSSGVVGKIEVRAEDTTPDTRMAFYTHDNNSGTGSLEERMRIDSLGNVGIGTTSPDTLLELVGADPILTIRDSETTGANTNATLRLAESGASDTLGNHWDINHTGNGELRFVQDRDGVNNERIRIDYAGNVGIGTTSPDYTLDIEADTAQARIHSTVGNSVLRLDSVDTGESKIFFADNSASAIGTIEYHHDDNYMSFDTVATERMRIDSSGKVGIGTSSPASKLHVDCGTDNQGGLIQSSDATVKLGFKDNTTTQNYSVTVGAVGDEMIFSSGSGGNETMRIDASGNLFVGKTTNSVDVAGGLIRADGKISACVEGDYAGIFHRKTSSGDDADGAIVHFRKDNVTIGSIGTNANDYLYVGNGDTNLAFSNSNDLIFPRGSQGIQRDGLIDLGNGSNRFKDIYLSGGVHLGGTGSANKLDDYEEGTWTPTLVGSTSGSVAVTASSNHYTKIGDTVRLNAYITIDGTNNNAVGELRIGGLPFVSNGHNAITTSFVNCFTFDERTTGVSGYTNSAVSNIVLRKGSSSVAINATEIENQTDRKIMINAVYRTTQ